MKFAALALTLVCSTAFAAMANWTGRQQYVTTVSGKQGIECEYRYGAQTFTRLFLLPTCPLYIEVQ